MSVLGTIVGLSLLIILHEAGHYLLARACGMRVLRFSVGFGPALVQRKVGETTFVANPEGKAEDDGWLLAYDYDPSTDASALLVIDARDMSAAPVARVLLPRRVPYGFHGTWVADA